MKRFRAFAEADEYSLKVKKDDVVKIGKFKNRVAVIKGVSKDDHGQPVLDTTKGKSNLLKGRLQKLEDSDAG